MGLTLRQLRYFCETVTAGNISRAAGRLNVAAPALSVQIKTLEGHLGVRLLNRHSRGVEPTHAGRALFEKSQKILSLIEDVELQLLPQNKRRMRVGMLRSALRAVGTEAIAAAQRRADGIDLYFGSGGRDTLLEGLQRGDLDLIFSADVDGIAGIRSHRMIKESLVFISRTPPFASGERLPLKKVIAHKLLFFAPDDPCHRVLQARATAEGLEFAPTNFIGSVEVIRQLLLQGDCAAVLPAGDVFEAKNWKYLSMNEIEDPPLVRSLYLAWREKHEAEPVLDKLVDFATECIVETYAHVVPFTRRYTLAGRAHSIPHATGRNF